MKKSLKGVIISGVIAVTLAGCGGSPLHSLDAGFYASPIKTKLTAALQCMGGRLETSSRNPDAYIFMVRDVVDEETHQDAADGAPADAGRVQMNSIFATHTKPVYGVVADEYPPMLRSVVTVDEQTGLNRFGVPSADDLRAYLAMMTEFTNTNRQAKGLAEVDVVIPLVIDGAFSLSNTRRSLALVLNVINPKNNVVVGTEAFDLKLYGSDGMARFRAVADEYFYGFSDASVRVGTVHTAKQILLEAAAIWIFDNAFGDEVDFTHCIDSEGQRAHTQSVRNGWNKVELIVPLVGQQVAVQPPASDTPAQPQAQTTQAAAQQPQAVAANTATQSTARVRQPINYAEPGWRVSAGIFAQPKNVDLVSGLLTRHGLDFHLTGVKVASGDATLIWLGPYAKQTVAARVSAVLKTIVGTKGFSTNGAFCQKCY